MHRYVRSAAVLLTLATLCFSLYLGLVGWRLQGYRENNAIQFYGPRQPAPLAVIPGLCCAVILFGLWSNRQKACWYAVSCMALFCAWTFLSLGILYLPVAAILGLLLPLSFRQNRPV
jgi:hypothetical protein